MNELPLFSRPDSFAVKALELIASVTDQAMPVNGAQRRDLPFACRDLSALLTTERDGLDRPYWTAPRLTSAYLRYFLPWNLVRLSALLPGLDLGTPPAEPLILDAGSGPLTLPIALWLSRPDLRALPVTVVASDTNPHIMEIGRTIFEKLRAGLDPESKWTVRTMRSSAARALHMLHAKPGTLWMLSMGNVLNEIEDRHARPGSPLSERMRSLLEDASAMLCENGFVFSVEPGTRQGGRLISHLRRSALGGVVDEPEFEDLTAFALKEEQNGRRMPDGFEDDYDDFGEDDGLDFGLPPLFIPVSPCPHASGCPLLDKRTTAWCHVNAPAAHAPEGLRELSAKAGLDKDSISLAFLLLRKAPEDTEIPAPARRREGDRMTARIISDAFVVPGFPGRARYACTGQGLALIPDSARLQPGSLCRGTVMHGFDRKSHAFLLSLDRMDDASRSADGSRGRGRPHPQDGRRGRRMDDGRRPESRRDDRRIPEDRYRSDDRAPRRDPYGSGPRSARRPDREDERSRRGAPRSGWDDGRTDDGRRGRREDPRGGFRGSRPVLRPDDRGRSRRDASPDAPRDGRDKGRR